MSDYDDSKYDNKYDRGESDESSMINFRLNFRIYRIYKGVHLYDLAGDGLDKNDLIAYDYGKKITPEHLQLLAQRLDTPPEMLLAPPNYQLAVDDPETWLLLEGFATLSPMLKSQICTHVSALVDCQRDLQGRDIQTPDD